VEEEEEEEVEPSLNIHLIWDDTEMDDIDDDRLIKEDYSPHSL
jgi:hypothetical protein